MLLWKESIHSSGCQQGYPELLTYLRFFITLTVLHLIKFFFFLKKKHVFSGGFFYGESLVRKIIPELNEKHTKCVTCNA